MVVRFVDGALFHEPTKTLVIADIHLGYEAEMRAKGAYIPSTELEIATKRIEKLATQFSPTTVVFNGDVKHSFGRISDGEWRQLRVLMTALKQQARVVFVKGNHDTHLAPVAKTLDIELVEHFAAENLLCLHGDALPNEKLLSPETTIVIGHVHPAIGFSRGPRQERTKCYLLGHYSEARLIVLPSFLQLTEGVDVLSASSNSPLIDRFDDFEILAVTQDGTLPFGTVKEVRSTTE